MTEANPIAVLAVALVASWLEWPRGRSDLRVALHRLIRSLARQPGSPAAGAAQGLALAALGALCGAAVVWIAVGQVAYVLRGFLPYGVAIAVEVVISGLLIATSLDVRSITGRDAGEGAEGVEAASLRWTRGVVTPLLLYAFGGLYGALMYGGAVEAWRALRASPSVEAPARWAERAVAVVHYLPARLGALAACVVRGRSAWQRLQEAPAGGLWHGEWVGAALDGAPQRAAGATLVLVVFCLLIMRW